LPSLTETKSSSSNVYCSLLNYDNANGHGNKKKSSSANGALQMYEKKSVSVKLRLLDLRRLFIKHIGMHL